MGPPGGVWLWGEGSLYDTGTFILSISKLDFVVTCVLWAFVFHKHILFYLQEAMNENIDDTENYRQFWSVQFECKPNPYEMSAVNRDTGAASRDNRPVNQTRDGSRAMESSATAQSVQNSDVQIKEEPTMDGTSGTSSFNETGFIIQLQVSHYPSDNTGKGNLDEHRDQQFVFRDGTDYAVCIKYEPNSCEEIDPVASVNDGNTSKAYVQTKNDHDTQDNTDNKHWYHYTKDNTRNKYCYYDHQDNGHSYHANRDNVDCIPASNDIQYLDTQIQYGPMQYEVSEHPNCLPCASNNSDSSVLKYYDHNHMLSLSYENIYNNDGSTEQQRTKETQYKSDISIDSISMPCHAETNYEKDTDNKEYNCDTCSYSSVYLHRLALHNLIRHKRKHTGEKPLKCDVCSNSTVKPSDFVRHNRKHTGEKLYNCDVCNYSTTGSTLLAENQVREKPYKCNVCSYSTFSSRDLVTHKRIHTGDKLHKCDVCSYSSVRSRDLVMHKRKHTLEKPYKCDVCSYSTTRSTLLAEHQAKHTGEKPYKCDVCSFRTVRFSNLVVHIRRKHTGEKPYKCDVCSYCTVRSSELATHKRKHTGEKPYKCDVCNFSTNWSRSLKAYKQQHTDEKNVKV